MKSKHRRPKRRSSSSVPSLIVTALTSNVVDLLANNYEVKEVKTLTGSSLAKVYDEKLLTVLRSTIGNRAMTFHVNASGVIASNGSGAIVSSLGVALSLMTEGAGLLALFAEVKLDHCTLEISGNGGYSASAIPGSCLVGFNPDGADSSTGSVSTSTVVSLPVVHLVPTSGTFHPMTISSPRLTSRPYAITSSDPTSSPSAGTLGSWWIINRVTLSNSFNYYCYRQRNIVTLRNRV